MTYLLKALDTVLVLYFRCITEIILIIPNVVITCAKFYPLKKLNVPNGGHLLPYVTQNCRLHSRGYFF